MLLALLASIGLFTPPPSWQACKSEETYVEVGFVTPGSNQFVSSITHATEEVDCTLKEYIQTVKRKNLEEPDHRWHDLGAFSMKAGRGHLVQITHPSSWGELVVLQAFYLDGKTMHVLTAGLHKDDRLRFKQEVLNAFCSFEIQPDLWSQSQLADIFKTLGKTQSPETEWKEFQTLVAERAPSLGTYWQYLALKEGHHKLYAKASP